MITRSWKRLRHDYQANRKGNTTLLILLLITGLLASCVLSFMTESDFEKEMIKADPIVVSIKNDSLFGNLNEMPLLAEEDPEKYALFICEYIQCLDRLKSSSMVESGTYHLNTILEYRNIPLCFVGIDDIRQLEKYGIMNTTFFPEGMILRSNVFANMNDEHLLPEKNTDMGFTSMGENVVSLTLSDYYMLSPSFDVSMGKGEIINVSSDVILTNEKLFAVLHERDLLHLLRVNQAEFRISNMNQVDEFQQELNRELEQLKEFGIQKGCGDPQISYEISDNTQLYAQLARTRIFYMCIFAVMAVNLLIIVSQFMNYLLVLRKKEIVIYMSLGRSVSSLSRHYVIYYGLIGLPSFLITPIAGMMLSSILNTCIAKANRDILEKFGAYTLTTTVKAQSLQYGGILAISLFIASVVCITISICITTYIGKLHRKNMNEILRG